jgi:hypothetical protein
MATKRRIDNDQKWIDHDQEEEQGSSTHRL